MSSQAEPVRIAVTGVGLVTPGGLTAPSTWETVLSGHQTASWVKLPKLSDSGVDRSTDTVPVAAAQVSGEDGPSGRVTRFALESAKEAAQSAQLNGSVGPERMGCVFGVSKGDFGQLERVWKGSASTEQLRFAWNSFQHEQSGAAISRELEIRGAVSTPVAACATGLVAIVQAANLIRSGVCDVVVTGSSDASLHLPLVASFQNMKVLADPGDDPQSACRPFDVRRTGFIPAEGAATLILEHWEYAAARGVPILAEWVGGLFRSDPADLTRLDESSVPLIRLITDLLHQSNVKPDQVGAVSMHGTGTDINDRYESVALFETLTRQGSNARGFALKGGLGHLLGAAGSVEAAVSVLGLLNRVVPPTVNLQEQDQQCPFPMTTDRSLPMDGDCLLKTSLGFGGHIAAGLFRRP